MKLNVDIVPFIHLETYWSALKFSWKELSMRIFLPGMVALIPPIKDSSESSRGKPVFWLKGFDVNDFKEEINKEAKCENGSSTKEYKIFLECPYEYSFTEINVSEYEDFDIDLTCKYEGIVDGTSVEFYKIKDKDYYVKVSDLGGCFADAYDWKEWFKMVTGHGAKYQKLMEIQLKQKI